MVGLEEAKDTTTTKAVYDENGKFLRNETTTEKVTIRP